MTDRRRNRKGEGKERKRREGIERKGYIERNREREAEREIIRRKTERGKKRPIDAIFGIFLSSLSLFLSLLEWRFKRLFFVK